MNALQPIEPLKSPRSKSKFRKRRRRNHSHLATAVEITIKLLVNGILSTAAIAAIIKLLPYHLSQQAKLREIRLEVKQTEVRVNQLSNSFNRTFALQEGTKVMEEQSYRRNPNQLSVVLVDKDSKKQQ